MIIVIDGYNMLRQMFPGVTGKLNTQKNYLIQQLSIYKLHKKDEIRDMIIVFDAGPLHHATREIHKGIVVIYSGQASTADEWIINYVKKHKDQEFVIITKDRGIIEACKQYNTQILDGLSLYQLITDVIAQASPISNVLYDQEIRKFTPVDYEEFETLNSNISTQELDFLMQKESNFVQEKDELDKEKRPISKTNKLSKKEKKFYTTLKKLS